MDYLCGNLLLTFNSFIMRHLFLILFLIPLFGLAQTDTVTTDTQTYKIVKTDGSEVVGKILKQDAREILVRTYEGREFFIPQHVISKIEKVKAGEFNAGGLYIGEDPFATRYFITTNGLPIKKGEHYIQWNLFGPDIEFGVADNFGFGVMTTWLAIPIVFSAKKSWQVPNNEKMHFAVGALAGTGSWAALDGYGVLPYGTISFGDRKSNIALSGGFVNIGNSEETFTSNPLASIALMTKLGRNVSFVFDSFIVLPKDDEEGTALLLPGIRWNQKRSGRSIQFGFAGVIAGGEAVPVPIPAIQFFQAI